VASNSLRNGSRVQRAMDPPPSIAAPSSRFVEWRCKRHGRKPCLSCSCRRVDNRRNKRASKFSAEWPSGGMDLLVLVAPSSRFVERSFKRHGWKPCPTRSCRRARVIDGTSGFKILCGMALGCRGEWDPPLAAGAPSSRSIKRAANGTAGNRALPVHPISRRFGEKCGTPRSGARDDGWGWKCGAEALLRPWLWFPPSQNRGRMGQAVCGRSEKVKGVGQECPAHTVIEQAGLIRWPSTRTARGLEIRRCSAHDSLLQIRTDNPRKLLARRGWRV
jgi:hypothetical protein